MIPYSHDDIVTGEMYFEVNKPVKMIIGSRDVIHDFGLVYFRQKMDAVPGTPTTMWFIPKVYYGRDAEEAGQSCI